LLQSLNKTKETLVILGHREYRPAFNAPIYYVIYGSCVFYPWWPRHT